MKKQAIAAMFIVIIGVAMAVMAYADSESSLSEICPPGKPCWQVQDVQEHNGVAVYWSQLYGDVTHHKYYVAIQNNNNGNKDFSPRALIDTSSLDLSQIKNMKISELVEKNKEVISYTSDCNDVQKTITTQENGTQAITSKECTTIPHTNIVKVSEWNDLTQNHQYTNAKAQADAKKINVKKYDVNDKTSLAYFMVEYDLPYIKQGDRYGVFNGRVAIQDTATGDDYHPFANTSFNRCMTINISSPYLLSNSTHELLFNDANFDYSETDANGLDLRFFEGGCQNQSTVVGRLSHWIKDWKQGATHNSTVYVMTKSENISQMSILWNFTGGIPDNLSNGSTTFVLFEDCQTTNLLFDWHVPNGSVSCSNGALNSETGNWNTARRNVNFTQPLKLEESVLTIFGAPGRDQLNTELGNSQGTSTGVPVKNAYGLQRNTQGSQNFIIPYFPNNGSNTNLVTVQTNVNQTSWMQLELNSTGETGRIISGSAGGIVITAKNADFITDVVNYVGFGGYDVNSSINYLFVRRMLAPYPAYSFGTVEVSQEAVSEAQGRAAIYEGIFAELPSAVNRNDTNITVRYANGTQKYGVFDVFASYGNQRWGFNYLAVNDNSTIITSIGTALNIYEVSNMNASATTSAVIAFINSTKQ